MQKLSGVVLPKEPPNTYLRRRSVIHNFRRFKVTSQESISTKDTPASSDRLEDISVQNEKVGDRLGSQTLNRANNWIRNQIQSMSTNHESLFGLENTRNVQNSLNDAQLSYLEAKEKRQAQQIVIDKLNLNHRKTKLPKSNMMELTTSMEALQIAAKEETDALSRLSSTIKETKNVEELLEKQIKRSSYIILA